MQATIFTSKILLVGKKKKSRSVYLLKKMFYWFLKKKLCGERVVFKIDLFKKPSLTVKKSLEFLLPKTRIDLVLVTNAVHKFLVCPIYPWCALPDCHYLVWNYQLRPKLPLFSPFLPKNDCSFFFQVYQFLPRLLINNILYLKISSATVCISSCTPLEMSPN